MNPAATVLLAGASGLVGSSVLDLLLSQAGGPRVLAPVRRPIDARSARLMAPVSSLSADADPDLLERLRHESPAIDAYVCCLGTTIKVAGSQAAFRAVDFDAVLAFARAAQAAGASRLGVVSALGADVKSSVFYNRVKGETEQALVGLSLPHLVIARPSLLLGERSALGQPSRPGERLAQVLMPAVGWLIPRKLRPISADAVAAALLAALADAQPGTTVLESDALQALAQPA